MPGPGRGGRRLMNPAAVRPFVRTDPDSDRPAPYGHRRRESPEPAFLAGREKLSPLLSPPPPSSRSPEASTSPRWRSRGLFLRLCAYSTLVGQAVGGQRSCPRTARQCRGAVGRARTRQGGPQACPVGRCSVHGGRIGYNAALALGWEVWREGCKLTPTFAYPSLYVVPRLCLATGATAHAF